jgi:hypothetical protein
MTHPIVNLYRSVSKKDETPSGVFLQEADAMAGVSGGTAVPNIGMVTRSVEIDGRLEYEDSHFEN